MSTTNLEQRIAELERRTTGMPDLQAMSPEEIAQGQARGTIPVGVAAPNPMARSMEMVAQHMESWNAQPLTPAEALARYMQAGERPNVTFLPQAVRLTSSEDHRRCDFPRGWHLVAPSFAVLSHGYCGAEQVPLELLERWSAWK